MQNATESSMQLLKTISDMGVLSMAAAALMMFGGVVPYIPQYIKISQTSSAEGFSTFVCFILLAANILRIFFWFGHRFELPLLAQSFIMIVTMLSMVQLCVRVQSSTEIIASKSHKFSDLDMKYFWRWTDFKSYLECLSVLVLVVGTITYMCLDVPIYVETLGLVALLCEAMLGVPQFYRNFMKKSTQGMSVIMVLMWTSGDLFKTGYFYARQAPLQFFLCGALQVTVDVLILLQVVYYGGQKSARI